MYFQVIRSDDDATLLIKKLLKSGHFIFGMFDAKMKFLRPSTQYEWEHAVSDWESPIEHIEPKNNDPFPFFVRLGKTLFTFYKNVNSLMQYHKETREDRCFYKKMLSLAPPGKWQAGYAENLKTTFKKIAAKNTHYESKGYYIQQFGVNELGVITFIDYGPISNSGEEWREGQKENTAHIFVI